MEVVNRDRNHDSARKAEVQVERTQVRRPLQRL